MYGSGIVLCVSTTAVDKEVVFGGRESLDVMRGRAVPLAVTLAVKETDAFVVTGTAVDS